MKTNQRTGRTNVSSFMKERKVGSYGKFALFKKIFEKNKPSSFQKSGKSKKPRNPYILLLKRLSIAGAFVFLLAILAGSIIVAVWVSNISKDLTGINPDAPFQNDGNGGDTLIFSKDGTELKRLTGLESKDFIKIDDVPDYVKAAFVAAEDDTFYENKGVDLFGILRAALGAVQKHEIVGGGSTITQQVVKKTLVGDKQDLNRKLKELILSVQIAKKYSKDQVLQLYINSIPFGSNLIGIKRAARTYFNKDVKDLTYAEAALLAGIPNEPARLAPDGYAAVPDSETYDTLADGTKIKSNIVRERYVLDRMSKIADQLAVFPGIKLDKEKLSTAKDEKIAYNYPKTESKAPHFTREGGPVYQELETIFKDQANVDEYITNSGLRVYTTLDYDMQQKAEAATSIIDDTTTPIPSSVCAYCASGVSNPTPWNVFGAKNAAMISVDPKTGAVLAYSGSSGFDRSDTAGFINGQVDILQEGVSQGSSMKPFNYMSGMISKGLAPSTVWANFKLDMGGGYKPSNFSIGDKPGISVTTAYALDNSLNIPAVQSMIANGMDNYIDLVSKIGYSPAEIDEIRKAGVTTTLGSAVISPYHQAQAYQVLANRGIKKNLYVIERVTDREGKELYQKKQDAGTKVVDEKYTWQIYNILKDYPTVSQIKKDGYDAAGKTGTNDFGPNGYPTSNVFWGYTPELVTGVWAGNSNNQPLRQYAVGEKLGQFMWTPYMRAVLPKFTKSKTTRPAGIVERTVCKDTGFLADDSTQCDKVTALFVDGQFPKKDDNHKKYRVSDCDGTIKLASQADELAGVAKDQVFVRYETNTGSSYIQKQIDDYAANVLKSPPPPTETCTNPRTGDGTLFTKITSPAEGTVFSGGNTVNITADSVSSTGTATFYFDNNQISTDTSAPYSAVYTIPAGTSGGSHVFKIVITDNGKVGTASSTIAVSSDTTPSVTPTIVVTSPSANAVRSATTDLIAQVSPAALSSVNFFYKEHSKPDSNYTYIGQASKPGSGNTYQTTWNTLFLAINKTYDILAQSTDSTIKSTPVTVKFS